MKDKSVLFTKLIICILVSVLSLGLFACSNSEEESSAPAEEVSQASVLSVQEASALLARDRLVTEIFICNSLCDTSVKKAERSFVSDDSEYSSFFAVEALMDSTYSKESNEKSFFLAYPLNNEPSVKNVEGKTSVFYHPGSGYNDFADESTVTVADTDSETVKSINAKTASGREVSLKAVYSNGTWLLEKGIYRSNPSEEKEFSNSFAESRSGSFSELSGNILVIRLFVSDEETEITETEEASFNEKVSSAAERMAIQASDYGLKPNFEYVSAYFDHDSILGTRVLDFDIMFAETGFGTLQAFAETNYDLSDYNGYFFAVYIDKDIETSAGVYDNTEDTEFYFGERILAGNSCTDSEIYMSMFKLLGAYGYDVGVLDEYTESLYKFYFPNDCMVNEDMLLSVMSPVTAYNCGVTDELDGLYRIFIPNN